jgi:hypothetical protein
MRLRASFDRHGEHHLHFKKSAYNWLCFCDELPPCYDSEDRRIDHTEFGNASFKTAIDRDLALLLANGKLQFMWWSIVGDDFHLAVWMFADLPVDLAKLDAPTRARLRPLAKQLKEAMAENVSFKLNAGKRVGNYNLARCRHVTDKSDAIFAEALGLEGVWEEIELLYGQIVKTDFSNAEEADDDD